jgi:hypothetical protein
MTPANTADDLAFDELFNLFPEVTLVGLGGGSADGGSSELNEFPSYLSSCKK